MLLWNIESVLCLRDRLGWSSSGGNCFSGRMQPLLDESSNAGSSQ